MTSGTVNFTETSPVVGDTLHANFSWSNSYPQDGIYALCYILNPNGNVAAWYNGTTPSGSRTVTCTANMTGWWSALLTIWDSMGTNIEYSASVFVSSASGPTLDAITCAHQPECSWTRPTPKDTFAYNEEVYVWAFVYWEGHNFNGQRFSWKWYHRGQLVWQDGYTYGSGWVGAIGYCLWWQIGLAYGPGSGYIEWYLDGEYLGRTLTYYVACPACESLPNQDWCERCDCYWYGGACHSTGGGHITTNPDTVLNFPDTVIGSCSAEQTIRVTSDGSVAAPTIISLEYSDANQYQCTNLTLPYSWPGTPGTYLDVRLRFCPTSLGDKWDAAVRFNCSSCPLTLQTQLRGTCVPQTVIGDIVEGQSTFYTGPFSPNTNVQVARVQIKNIGNTAGRISYKLYEYPGETGEHLLASGSTLVLNPGSSAVVNLSATTPATGPWSLGVKVWGETETEPPW